MQDLFDNTDPVKIVRKDDPETSVAAANNAPTGNMRAFVFGMIQDSGKNGITIKEMTKANPEIQSSSITSRPNELEKSGHVFYLGDKRDGSRIIRASKYDTGSRHCSKCGVMLLDFYNMECHMCNSIRPGGR